MVSAPCPLVTGANRLGAGRHLRWQWIHRRLRRWPGDRTDRGARWGTPHPLHRGGRTGAQPERVLYLWGLRVWSNPTLELAGGPVRSAQPDVDPHASCSGFVDRHEAERTLGAVHGLVRPSGTSLSGVGTNRGGGGSPARRPRPDRASGGLDGAPERAIAWGQRCSPRCRVRPLGREDDP